jgi:hypothetical protein
MIPKSKYYMLCIVPYPAPCWSCATYQCNLVRNCSWNQAPWWAELCISLNKDSIAQTATLRDTASVQSRPGHPFWLKKLSRSYSSALHTAVNHLQDAQMVWNQKIKLFGFLFRASLEYHPRV